MLFSGKERRTATLGALERLQGLVDDPAVGSLGLALSEALSALDRPLPDTEALWRDYESRASDYYAVLGELGDMDLDVDAAQGFIPAEIAAKVGSQQLDATFLKVSLRGYQAFGAKFALVQRRCILGDEMGLGKTVEALTALAHLRALGSTHFLVVCPASVLVNWIHEIYRRSALQPLRVHGSDREASLLRWARQGGVAVTTFESLRALAVPEGIQIAMLVVDEAHYIKNSTAQRSQVVTQAMTRADRVLFLTGTPMENRVEEFRTLVGYLQPQIATDINGVDGVAGATAFRKAVAPVYLRRNQADVLTELPERLEAEDWVELGGEDLTAYRAAVASGNFMAMRRAAYAPGNLEGSAKLARLQEIVEESAANGWKMVVFSYFRDVLEVIRKMIGEGALGPLTGSVPPTARQALVDEFTAIEGHAVLVSQIQAGGVGLNIQAASVVVLAEPQWKPSSEDQAIARCHRMGQVRRVRVHRLLAKDSVDQRMLEILRRKALLFDEYVRRSTLSDESPDAIDVSDVDTTREVSEAEAERQIIKMERERLGLEPAPA
ncbi:MAG: DEAD/DEAH box helicase [Egibacteraceae bacterium]